MYNNGANKQDLADFKSEEIFEKPKVSVIVPCYNVEKYIEKCLKSLINQTLRDIEIICINDGSTDSTPTILKSFSETDTRIKVLEQKNNGVSAARNLGMSSANGEYISFIDSDDYVDENYLEKLYLAATANDCDIAAATIIRKHKHSQKYRVHYTEEKIYTTLEEKIKACNVPTCCYVWNKLYKASFIKSYKFTENVYYEDVLWTPVVLKNSSRFITVPDINYYYISNSNSIVKKTQSPKKQQDSYNSKKFIIKFFEENNLELPKKARSITKSIKYLFGIPILKTKEINNQDITTFLGFIKIGSRPSQKVFLVFNTAYLGDVLLCNSLCQNIKALYPDSHIVFICDKKFSDAATYQKDVDEVIIYDKKGINKGLGGMIKFVKEFPYKKPFAAFITYKNLRNSIIARLLNSSHIIEGNKIEASDTAAQVQHSNLLKKLTNSPLANYPIRYSVNETLPENLRADINNFNGNIICLCPITKNPPKDMPVETGIELIKLFNNNNKYAILLTGVGQKVAEYAKKLEKAGCKFINLTDKTTIKELALILKECRALISTDTGTMHLGCAVNIPVISVFYEENTLNNWAPNPEIYNSVIVSKDQNSENIYKNVLNLIGETND